MNLQVGILLITISLCTASTLKCTFKNDFVFRKYSCVVKELKIENRNTRITFIEGQHEMTKSNDDVECLRVERIQTMEFFTNDFFLKFPNMQNLAIHDGPLKHLLRGDFAMADNLVSIHITHTDVTDLEDYVFFGTKVLKTLNLRENKIRTIAENAFKGLMTLKFLTLSYNEIHMLHMNIFKDLNFLEQLSLGSNKLRHIDENLFSKNRHLEIIFLDNNQLTSISGNMFSRNENLREIYMDNNQIKHVSNIPEFLTNLKQLEVAVFSNNTCVNSMFLITKGFYPPYERIFENCQIF
ncbi:CLUMA_CG001552, isoform A [Clunio marinus]|uniref:CLUMA_CG001552, isoform A n=1 Tax=Clunio marinus TaxID=568069 RepID=A0A1J1HID0_9DIPT|nr:CLUMA_CG001552, isoform A [Clunio marinus]